jgi:hypothetical protein
MLRECPSTADNKSPDLSKRAVTNIERARASLRYQSISLLEGRHGSAQVARVGQVVEGAHPASSDNSFNRTWFGIELEGDNREADRITPEQYASLVDLHARLMTWPDVTTLPNNQLH